ncbi:lasso peptide biosynthesis PqqD family chaperone [Paenibacillus sambharensis]|uniref:Lasso peptide biosynthesis PqqD family chaperone n=1 Tax=Paenibacillus sambharensis TaxID=1803190 RepID=A0A2W1M250_9BACL|nr:lasso peptide biosynthesis PqqD family chaperone [Paenibacillus sambharensis]PZD97717.1 lasso peptide biosynthesis PqqD family chaperone [Paenibacillus sambharensis]
MAANTAITSTDKIIQAQGGLVTDMDGEKVMMSITNGKYYSLGEVGSRIWELAASPVSMEDIVSALLQEYEVDPAACRTEVAMFLEQLRREGLIHVAPAERL